MKIVSAGHLLLFAIMFALLNSGTCVKCYFCFGANDLEAYLKVNPSQGSLFTSDCVSIDPDNNNIPTRDCRADCVKGVVVTEGVTLTMRGCTEPPQCKAKTGECHRCSTDLCNYT